MFFATIYPGVVLLVQFDIYVLLWYYTERTKPCSVLWMNALRSAVFALSAVTSFCIAVDISTQYDRSSLGTFVEWMPFTAHTLGVLTIIITLIRRIRHINLRGGQALLQRSKEVSRKPDTSNLTLASDFDDAASLRGFTHRLAAVQVRVAARQTLPDDNGEMEPASAGLEHRIIGLQCKYEMDGIPMTMPPHMAPKGRDQWELEGWDVKDESLVLERPKPPDGDRGESIEEFGLMFEETGGVAVGLQVRLAPEFHEDDDEQVEEVHDVTKTFNFGASSGHVTLIHSGDETFTIGGFYGRIAHGGVIEMGAILTERSSRELRAIEKHKEARKEKMRAAQHNALTRLRALKALGAVVDVKSKNVLQPTQAVAGNITVAVRCRPFSVDDKLGVEMADGAVRLINTPGVYEELRTRVNYSWWSGDGYERHCKSDKAVAKGMHMIDQRACYDQCWSAVKDELLGGAAVVLFAYGLSGSGKTFSMFGQDDASSSDAWFHQKSNRTDAAQLWGAFPRIAYELLQNKSDGWRIRVKHFQNVVDTVRDLISPVGEEKHCRAGLQKDADGYMDIEWCQRKIIDDWEGLCETFLAANARKATAPTQFNRRGTRGHCFTILEVEKPKDDDPSSKDLARLYVCDLAGTEPAGDIFYAEYVTVNNADGTTDCNLLGQHKNQRKTKELQDQGKKINLSLSEMASFCLKMARAVKKKTLKPGKTIPGCNSYFLCKFIKDTMVQSRTYLCCAIRPEVIYHKYSYATLGFAKNASVIKLAPKKAVTAASPAERKLMAELAAMKALVAELQAAGGAQAEVEALKKALADKQASMANMMAGDDAAAEEKMKQQQQEYAHRGITLPYFSKDTEHPHLVNVDEDPFRSERFMYVFEDGEYTFGPGGRMRPPGLTVVRDHCKVLKEGDNCKLVGGKGSTFVSGAKVGAGEERVLAHLDRIVMGSEVFLFTSPGGEGKKMPIDEMIDEYQQGLMKAGGGGDDTASAAMAKQMAAFEKEKRKWAEQQAQANGGVAASDADAAKEAQTMLAMEKEIAELMPKTKQLKQICDIFNRDMLTFDVSFQRGSIAGSGMGTPSVKVRVTNHASDEHVFIDPFEFTKSFSLLRDEMQKMRNAIENDREYLIPEQHDPVTLLFHNTFFLGAAVIFPEFLIYNLETDEEDVMQDITSVGQGARSAGKLEIKWTPLASADEDEGGEVPDILDPDELIGKPWHAKCSIKGAIDLPLMVDAAYCQYNFWDSVCAGPQTFTTDKIECDGTSKPMLDYEFVHTIDSVTQEFIDFVASPLEVRFFVCPDVVPPKDKVGMSNTVVVGARPNTV
eukprot:SAG22_NODE_232_length_14402_cov_58.042159_7_plen_1312_part_00